jgi:putative tryptophan/tyrosine transport system substrate-binding protein
MNDPQAEGHMASYIGRREFLATLGGAAAAWPHAARAQQATMPVIGILAIGAPEANAIRLRAIREGLRTVGYVEGQNVKIEYRWAEVHTGRLPALAAELVSRQVAVIVASSTPAVLAAKAATGEIPIVFGIAIDPVELGLVASLNRPGGNVTGVTSLNIEVAPKRLELMHELLPSVTSMALLVNPAVPALAEPISRSSQAAAQTLGLQLHAVQASSDRDFDAVFDRLIQLRAGALVIGPDNLFTIHKEQLAKLTVRHAMPAVYQYREFAAAGGLMSYGTSETEYYRLVGTYAGRVLKGDKPADLPVQQSTKVELFLNLKTAKALGITVPLPLSGRADEVIE